MDFGHEVHSGRSADRPIIYGLRASTVTVGHEIAILNAKSVEISGDQWRSVEINGNERTVRFSQLLMLSMVHSS